MIKKTIILAAVFAALPALASLAVAQGAAPEFDGRNAPRENSSLVEMVKTNAPAVKMALPKPNVTAKGFVNSKPCKTVEYNSSNGPVFYHNISLTTQYTWRVCEDVYVTASDGSSATVSQCHPESVDYNATVHINMGSRQLATYEKERIEVCYDFKNNKGSFAILQSPFQYTYRDLQGDSYYTVDLFPGARKPQAPETGVLELSQFSYDDITKEFKLKLATNFSPAYAGSKVHIGAELVQDKLFDSSLGTKFFEFPLNSYNGDFTLTFKESDFASDKDSDTRGKAKKFFVKWGFKVKGAAFTDNYVEKGKTDAVSVIQ